VESRILAGAPLLDRDPAIVERCFRGEYGFIRQSLASADPDTLGVDLPSPLFRLFYKPNRTLASYAAAIRTDIAQIDLPPPRRAYSESWFEEGALRRSILRANSGEWLLAHDLGNSSLVLDKLDRVRLTARAVRTLVALRAYERTHRALPPDLEALVSAIPALGGVPIDPWSGAPLRYDAARRIIWSVGEDGVDAEWDELAEFAADPSMDRYSLPDWIWRIPPLPEAAK
jgi:hypothetical protein